VSCRFLHKRPPLKAKLTRSTMYTIHQSHVFAVKTPYYVSSWIHILLTFLHTSRAPGAASTARSCGRPWRFRGEGTRSLAAAAGPRARSSPERTEGMARARTPGYLVVRLGADGPARRGCGTGPRSGAAAAVRTRGGKLAPAGARRGRRRGTAVVRARTAVAMRLVGGAGYAVAEHRRTDGARQTGAQLRQLREQEGGMPDQSGEGRGDVRVLARGSSVQCGSGLHARSKR